MTRKIDPFSVPSLSYWITSVKPAGYQPLGEDVKVDVAIVGGGLVGIIAAYLLKRENLTVAVVEANQIGGGTSGHTTAKITSQHGLIYSKFIARFGLEKTRQYAEANAGAITFLEEVIDEEGIDCDFSKQPAYIYTQKEQYVKQIEDEVSAVASLGLKAHYLEEIPLPFKVKAAERFDNQAQFHPGKFLSALAAGITGGGSHVFEQTRAIDFLEGTPFTIITENGFKVIAEKVIMASHFPAYDGGGYYFTRMLPDRSYALAVTAEEKFPGGLYITAGSPTRSLRSTPYGDGELIIVVGEHHRTGHGPPTAEYYRNLAHFAEQTFTLTGIPFRWSAQDYTTLDEIPYVGRLSPQNANIYVATGFRKWGITNGTAAAILLKDLIVHGESPWEAVYDPARFKIDDPALKETAAKHLADARERAESSKPENIPREKGALLPASGKAIKAAGKEGAIGIYKDSTGQVHVQDMTCTHMSCELTWNEAELTWDCPCHGSRFTYDGEIVEGPALKPLQAAALDQAIEEE